MAASRQPVVASKSTAKPARGAETKPAIAGKRRPVTNSRKRPATARNEAPTSRLSSAPRTVSATEAVQLIQPGDHVYLPVGHAIAGSVVEALIERTKTDTTLSPDNPIHVLGLTNVASRKLYMTGGDVVPITPFIGANNRDAIAEGLGGFVPAHLSRVPRLMREGKLRVDVAVIQVSPPDDQGYVTLGSSTATTLAALDTARIVIAEVNPNVPRTYGAARIHRNRITYRVDSDAPLRTIEPTPIADIDAQIAKHVMTLIPKNPTLQFGIGSTTDAIAESLVAAGRTDLRIHSEMISDGVMKLAQSGSVVGLIRYSFALGSKALLRWMDGNKRLRSGPSDIINDPRLLGQIKNLIAINTALRVDLHGQVNAQYVDDRHYSGTGGQQDFFRGAMMSKGGKAILVLPSTSEVLGEDGNPKRLSRIVFALDDGDLVTTSLNDIQYVVTEYGVADLEGKTTQERAEALVAIAHPDFRGELQAQIERRDTKRAERVRERAEARLQANQPPAARTDASSAASPSLLN